MQTTKIELKLMIRSLLMLVLSCALLNTVRAADDAELAKLQGKWEVKKTNSDGQKVKQTIEVKKDKLTFKIMSEAGDTLLVATADVKLQKLGAFTAFTTTKTKYGQSEDALEATDEERSYIYQISPGTFTVAVNMDAEREEPPALEVYKKVSSGK